MALSEFVHAHMALSENVHAHMALWGYVHAHMALWLVSMLTWHSEAHGHMKIFGEIFCQIFGVTCAVHMYG